MQEDIKVKQEADKTDTPEAETNPSQPESQLEERLACIPIMMQQLEDLNAKVLHLTTIFEQNIVQPDSKHSIPDVVTEKEKLTPQNNHCVICGVPINAGSKTCPAESGKDCKRQHKNQRKKRVRAAKKQKIETNSDNSEIDSE